jgi:hypothetical protein
MNAYHIYALNGPYYGCFRGECEAEALAELHKDAGHTGIDFDSVTNRVIFEDTADLETCGNVEDWDITEVQAGDPALPEEKAGRVEEPRSTYDQRLTITLKDYPVIADAVRRHTRRKKCIVVIRDSGEVEVTAPHWDGGSKDAWFHLARSGATRHVAHSHSPWPAPPARDTVEITEGGALVSGGTFRGKPAFLTLYIRPQDAEAWGVAPA